MVETLDNDPNQRPRSGPLSPSEIEEESIVEADAEEDPQSQYMDASPPHPSADEPKAPPPTTRKAGGKKRKPLTAKQKHALQEKLSLLGSLEPHPFLPNKSDFDVVKHERALRALGLWDFANLKLDREIQKDLLIDFIAHRDAVGKRSFVNGVRIGVSRAELARALKIPNRKAVPVEELEDRDRETFTETSTTTALVQFLLSWIVLAGEVGIIPPEAQAAIELIQSGNAPKVDWAGLLWIMVEKELSEAPKSGVCYYASHLQQLIRSQKPALLETEDPSPVEVPVAETYPADAHAADSLAPDGAEDAGACESAENHTTDDHATTEVQAIARVRTDNSHDMDVHGTEHHLSEEAQAAVDVADDKLDMADKKEPEKQQDLSSNIEVIADEEPLTENTTTVEEAQQHWLSGNRDDVPHHGLQRCTSTVVPSMDIDEGIKEEPELADKERHEDDFTSKFPNLDASTDLLQSMDEDPYFPSSRQVLGSSCGEFLSSRHDTHTTMSLNSGRSASTLFQDTEKRASADIADEDEEEGGIHQFSHELPSKRMRTEQPWDNPPSTYNFYFEQAFNSLSKMKMVHEQNHQELINAQMQIHYLNSAVHQKDHYIQSLERTMMEEQQKRQVHFHHLEYEHNVMSRLVVGYQKALKEARQAFSAYRKRFPQGEEPLYKDAGGPGGTVLTTRELERQYLEKLELEKQQLQRRELENQFVINMVLRFSREWSSKFENYSDKVQQFVERLNQLKEKTNLLSERNLKTEPSPQVSE